MTGSATSWSERATLVVVGALLTLTLVHVVTSEPALVGERRVGAYEVGCLPGGGSTAGNVCSLVLGMPRDSRGEPWIAVHPDDPDILVVAAIARSLPEDAEAAGDPEPEEWQDEREPVERVQDEVSGRAPPSPPETLPRGTPCSFGNDSWPHLCLHVTEDAGATWVARRLPMVAHRVVLSDPVALFTPDGTLHVFGHKADGGEIAHVRSTDLGRTWDDARLLTGTGVDRPWAATDPDGGILLTWQQTRYPYRSGAAYSGDQGETFRDLGSLAGCLTHGPPIHIMATTWWFACTGRPAPEVGLYAVDVATGDTTTIDHVHGWFRPAWTLHGPNGTVALLHSTATGMTTGRLLVHTTPDGGATWGPTWDVLAVTAVDDGWSWHWVSWAASDTAGILHILLVGGDTTPECYSPTRCPDPGNDREVAWLAIDPTNGDLLGEARLSDGPRERPADARRYVGDDYHHMVPYGEGMLLAWGHEAAVELAVVRPTV